MSTSTVSTSRWVLLRGALEEAAGRFCELLRTVAEPDAPAVGDWTIGDTAAHLREVTLLNRLWGTGAAPPASFRTVYDKAGSASIDEVSEVNAMALAWEPSRDLHVLARHIGDQVSALLEGTAGAGGDEKIRWMGGISVPVEAVLGHTMSELLVHGRDIARAERRPFPISPADVRLVFGAFLLGILGSADPAQFAGDRPTGARGVTCEIRLRGSEPALFEVDDSRTTLHEPGTRRPDVRISADPVAMWLLMAGRISPVLPALRGQVVVSGRRPWRLRRLIRMMRMP